VTKGVPTSEAVELAKRYHLTLICGARRDENITYYEIQIPWKELLPSGVAPEDYLVFSMLINENDGNGRRGWIEWGSGIATQKTALLFKQVCMGK